MKKFLFMAWTLLMAVVMQAATVTFSASEWAAAQGLDDGDGVTSYTQEGVTVTFAQGEGASAPSWNSSQSTIAVVSGNTMKIAVAEGYELKQVVMTLYANSQASNLVNDSWSAGKVTADGTKVTWKGIADNVSATLSAVGRFVSFEVTYSEKAAPIVEDESKYNDTTEVTIAEWFEFEGYGNGDEFSDASYTKEGKTLSFSKGNGSTPRYYTDGCSPHLYFHFNNTLHIESPYKMRKVVFDFCSAENAEGFFNAETPDAGILVLKEKQVIWLGENRQMNWINDRKDGNNTIDVDGFIGITVISDTTDNQVTVTFYDFDGKVLKSEKVTAGSSVTPPTIDDDCFEGWDQSTAKVMDNMDVRPIKKVFFSLTAKEWDKQTGLGEITVNGFTLSTSTRRTTVKDEVTVLGLKQNTGFTILNRTWLYNLVFSCHTVTDAVNFAGSSCSSGALKQEGTHVRWTGSTDSLYVNVTSESVVYIVSIASECQPLDHFTVVFLGEDGQTISTQDVEAGSDAVAPSDPKSANECKLFAGWDTDFTNVHSDLTIKPLWQLKEDCVPEGYVKVVFVDIFNKPIGDPQFILIGGNAVAPENPTAKYHTFVGWDHPLTNITESVTIKPLFEFDNNSPDILSIPEWNEIKWDDAVPGEAYAVRGIFSGLLDYDVEQGAGQLSFRVMENGEYSYSTSLEAYRTLYVDREPFVNNLQLRQGDTVIVYGVFGRDVILNPYQDDRKYTGLFDGYVTYHRRKIYLPNAALMYDFSGNGLKQVASITTEVTYDGDEWDYNTRRDTRISLWASGDYSDHFGTVEYLGGTTVLDTRDREFDTAPVYIEDMNHDGKPDLSTRSSFYLSQASDFTMIDRAIAVTNMDINRDGRPDYISLERSEPLTSGYANYGSIMYQLPGGSFRQEQMQVFTWDEFVEQMTPEELDQYQNPQKYSLGDVSRYTYTLELGGACLAHAPKRHARDVQKAPGIGPEIDAPTHAIDMNGDGLVDLIDEKVGVIYTNMDNGKWVWTQTNGAVIPVDLNGDGVTDFIFPGSILYTSIFDKSTNTFVTTTLYENATVDKLVYCYDFDKDGDVDILATFSSAKNSTGYAYTCFFTNDGNGKFTKVSEQNYGSNSLWFSALQDIDGDGNYDLLALRAKIEYMNTTLGSYYSFSETPELVWLRGSDNMQFAAPASFGSFDAYSSLEDLLVNAEDLNGDGKQTLWISGIWSGTTPSYALSDATVNARPTAPAAPTLSYKDGILTVTWGNGSDDKTAVSDLTYALRIGTTAGGNDILMAHANADGSRRNFMDGNMGRTHKYTIDLRSYAPATIYVAVQAIDAQHSGSVWSQEATAVHGFVPVEFVLDRSSVAINETAVLTYTALPEDYKHTWTIQDGSYVAENEGARLRLSFTSGGEKTVTHTVKTPNGSTLSASATITVLPAGLGEALELTEAQTTILNYAQADYNYDGRMDGFNGQTKTVHVGTNTDELFVAAEGLWNTNIDASGTPRWFDWNKDGHVDLVFQNAYLPHEANGTSLTPLVYDDNLKDVYPQNTGVYTDTEYYILSDLDNNGYLDSLLLVTDPNKVGADIYVWYHDAAGILAEGFLIRDVPYYAFRDCYLTPNDHRLQLGNKLYPIVAQADSRPAAPTNVQAAMTNEGLLITWTAAVDDHTPAANMRYNLSVKQQGASTYLISPQNGGNENAAFIPGYEYVEGTRYLIPTSELTNANYEIAMQALDRQNKLSVFSQTITVTVKRNPIEVPSFGCADEEIVVSYRGAEMTGTPVWDFDGGQAKGSGFGPYTVVWTTGGEKNVTLTLNGQTYSAKTTIDDPKTLDVSLPAVLYEGTSALASVPSGIAYQWFVSIDGSELYPIDHYGILLPSTSIFVSYDYRLSVQGLNITAWYRSDHSDKTLVGHEVRLYLRVTNANGCETYFYSDVTVLAATDIPTLTLISTDANGHNVLSWANASAFATINVYKEGSAINDFRLLGSTAAADGSFVDANSDATEKAERYYITGVTKDGSESPASTIHKTVHLAINRGVTSGTFNLIWNEYAGASVASYVILRGASPTSLSQIAVVAASNTSYTDQTPEEEEPYYAIEYVLSYAAAAPANRANIAQEDQFTGRSNVVNRNELGIDDIAAPSDKVMKVLQNGQIYILIGNKVYTITGQEIVQFE